MESNSQKPSQEIPTTILDGNNQGEVVYKSRMVQPMLFATDELLLPEKINSFKKSVAAIHAYPLNTNFSLNVKRLQDACIYIAGEELRKKTPDEIEEMRATRQSPLFQVSLQTLTSIAGLPKETNYKRTREYLDILYDTSMSWNVLGDDAEIISNHKAHFFSSLGYATQDSRALAFFSFDPSVLFMVLEPAVWAKISFQTQNKLPTLAALNLYQNVWRFSNTKHQITSALTPQEWCNLLVGPNKYIKKDPKTNKEKFDYGEFKRRVLLDAMLKINENKALSYIIKEKETFSGKKVIKLQFKLLPKNQGTLDLPITWPKDILDLLNQIGYERDEIPKLSETYSLADVIDAVKRLKENESKPEFSIKFSRKRYFKGILNNIVAGTRVDDIRDEELLKEIEAEETAERLKQNKENAQRKFRQHQDTKILEFLDRNINEQLRVEILNNFELKGVSNKNIKNLMPHDYHSPLYFETFRAWLFSKGNEETLNKILPGLEDRSFESWLLSQLNTI